VPYAIATPLFTTAQMMDKQQIKDLPAVVPVGLLAGTPVEMHIST